MYVYVYKSFSTKLDRGLRKKIKKKKEMEKLEMKSEHWTGNRKSETNYIKVNQRWSCGSAGFKHDCSLETYFQLFF